MAEIRPEEISAILREQLSQARTDAELEEVGTVLQVGDGIARVYGLGNVRAGELVEFENGVKAIALNLEEDNVGVVLMGEMGTLQEGAKVRRTGQIASIKVGEGMVGRVVNTLGEPIDGKGPIATTGSSNGTSRVTWSNVSRGCTSDSWDAMARSMRCGWRMRLSRLMRRR